MGCCSSDMVEDEDIADIVDDISDPRLKKKPVVEASVHKHSMVHALPSKYTDGVEQVANDLEEEELEDVPRRPVKRDDEDFLPSSSYSLAEKALKKRVGKSHVVASSASVPFNDSETRPSFGLPNPNGARLAW